MDISLPERITKKIANQARLCVASYLNNDYHNDHTDSNAEIVCYESIVHDLVDKFRRPYNIESQQKGNHEQAILQKLKLRYGNDVSYATKGDGYTQKYIWVSLGMGAKMSFHWNEYRNNMEVGFLYGYIYGVDVDYNDFDNIVEIIDFVRVNISTWQPLAAECIRDFRKRQKILEIKQTAVKSFATQKLDTCGLPYRLEQGKLRDKIFFKVSDKEMAMFYLSHKNFDTAIDKIIAAAKQIIVLIKETGLQLQIKKIGDYDHFVNDK